MPNAMPGEAWGRPGPGWRRGAAEDKALLQRFGRVKRRGGKGTRVSCVILSEMTSGRISMVVGRVWLEP